MKSLVVRSLLLLALLPGSLAAKQAEKQPEKQPEPPAAPSRDAQTIRYELRSLDLHAAEVLAWDQCAQKERCRVASTEITGHKYLEVGAEPAVQEKIARALAREDLQPRTHGFQILLLASVVATQLSAQSPRIATDITIRVKVDSGGGRVVESSTRMRSNGKGVVRMDFGNDRPQMAGGYALMFDGADSIFELETTSRYPASFDERPY